MNTVDRLVDELAILRSALVTIARLETLVGLGERGLAVQRERAENAVRRIEEAALLDDYLRSSHGVRINEVCWPASAVTPVREAMSGAAVDLARARPLLERWRSLAASLLADLRERARRSPLFAAASLRLEALSLDAQPLPVRSVEAHAIFPPPETGARKVAHGPRHVPLDARFLPSFSLLQSGRDPTMTGDDLDRAPYFWCLAAREAMAAELCALNLLEYDGLPISYYRDFCKQQWDERRHAEYFLSVGLDLLPGFLAQAPASHPLRAAALAHAEAGAGLPIPLEGNLYQLARDATLVQRLVLMHHDTESPGVGAFLKQVRSPWGKAHPAIADGLYSTVHDEAAHARIGRRWLKHLLPTRTARSQAIDEARTLRGFLLLSAMAGGNQLSLAKLLEGESEIALPAPLERALKPEGARKRKPKARARAGLTL